MVDVVTSLVGLIGVAVGGGIAYLTQRQLSNATARRDRELEERAATAVARLMRDDLYRAQNAIRCHCLRKALWWRGSPMRGEPQMDELKLLASYLEWDRWAALGHALGEFRELSLRRDQADPAVQMSGDDRRYARFVWEALEGARAALSGVTGGGYFARDPMKLAGRHPRFTRDLLAAQPSSNEDRDGADS